MQPWDRSSPILIFEQQKHQAPIATQVPPLAEASTTTKASTHMEAHVMIEVLA